MVRVAKWRFPLGFGRLGELAIIGGWTVAIFVVWNMIWIGMFPWGATSEPLYAPFGTCDIGVRRPFWAMSVSRVLTPGRVNS
jgi:hypothetical protein